MRRENIFQGGTAGATITAANSGGASGDPFQFVTIGASGASVTYDSTRPQGAAPWPGPLAMRFNTGTVAGHTSNVQWTFPVAGEGPVWTRFYIYLDQQPNAGAGFLRAVAFYTGATQNAGAVVTGLGLGGGGQWQYLNSAGGSAVTGIFNNTGGGALNQWQRIEAQYNLGAAGTIVFRDFIAANVHGTTPSRTFTSGATAMSGAPGQIRFGHTTGELNIRGWLAMVAVSDEGWIGPWTPPPPPPAGPRAWDGTAWRTEGRAWDGAAWRTPGRAWDGTGWRG